MLQKLFSIQMSSAVSIKIGTNEKNENLDKQRSFSRPEKYVRNDFDFEKEAKDEPESLDSKLGYKKATKA